MWASRVQRQGKYLPKLARPTIESLDSGSLHGHTANGGDWILILSRCHFENEQTHQKLGGNVVCVCKYTSEHMNPQKT